MKICNKKDCSHEGKPQPIESFYKDDKSRGGRRQDCKECVKKSPSRSKKARREYELRKEYNITLKDFDNMKLTSQAFY